MRDLEADWEDSYDYGPNEMARLHTKNPDLYDKIMRQNVGDKSDIEEFYRRNLEQAKKDLAQQGM